MDAQSNIRPKQNYVRGCTRFQIKTFLEFLFGDNILHTIEKNREYVYIFPKDFFKEESRQKIKIRFEAYFGNQVRLYEAQ